MEKCLATSLRTLTAAAGEDVEKKEKFFIDHVMHPEKYRPQPKPVEVAEKEDSEGDEKDAVAAAESKVPSPGQKTITSLFKVAGDSAGAMDAEDAEDAEDTEDDANAMDATNAANPTDATHPTDTTAAKDEEMEGSSEEEEYAYGEEGEEGETDSSDARNSDSEMGNVDVENMEAFSLSEDSEDDVDLLSAQRSGAEPDAKRCCVQDSSSPDGGDDCEK